MSVRGCLATCKGWSWRTSGSCIGAVYVGLDGHRCSLFVVSLFLSLFQSLSSLFLSVYLFLYFSLCCSHALLSIYTSISLSLSLCTCLPFSFRPSLFFYSLNIGLTSIIPISAASPLIKGVTVFACRIQCPYSNFVRVEMTLKSTSPTGTNATGRSSGVSAQSQQRCLQPQMSFLLLHLPYSIFASATHPDTHRREALFLLYLLLPLSPEVWSEDPHVDPCQGEEL